MKVLEKHENHLHPWWHNRKSRCFKCGTVTLLEEGDPVVAVDGSSGVCFGGSWYMPSYAKYKCQGCGDEAVCY